MLFSRASKQTPTQLKVILGVWGQKLEAVVCCWEGDVEKVVVCVAVLLQTLVYVVGVVQAEGVTLTRESKKVRGGGGLRVGLKHLTK
jgi:hypothetical protein